MTAPALPLVLPLVAFELRVQRREFLAWLAALVFALLTFGYGASGVVELVGDRGTLPRAAPWAIAQAMAGVTAFGQVITAMIAATTVLRDVGTRSQGLILATPLPWPTYLLGRFLGTLAVLGVIYAMIPVGLVTGFAAGDAAAVGTWRAADVLLPLGVLVVPTVVLVAAVFFAAGARSGGFAVILFVGIGLVGLWQTGLALEARGVAAGAWLDPFGNAILAHVTRGWDSAARTSTPIPWTGLVLWHRAAWLVVALATLTWTVRTWRPGVPTARAVRGDAPPGDRDVRGDVPPGDHDDSERAPARAAVPRAATPPTAWQQFAAEARFGWRWVLRERGYTALLVLAVANAVANGWPVANDPPALLRALEFHARIFAILLATIYAGELVWRDRDVRADGLLGAVPARSSVRLAGRTGGVLAGLLGLPLVLTAVAMALPLVTGSTPDAACALTWMLGVSAPLFAALLGMALAVHVAVPSKTVAHLLLITAWVVAIALGARGLALPWADYGRC